MNWAQIYFFDLNRTGKFSKSRNGPGGWRSSDPWCQFETFESLLCRGRWTWHYFNFVLYSQGSGRLLDPNSRRHLKHYWSNTLHKKGSFSTLKDIQYLICSILWDALKLILIGKSWQTYPGIFRGMTQTDFWKPHSASFRNFNFRGISLTDF